MKRFKMPPKFSCSEMLNQILEKDFQTFPDFSSEVAESDEEITLACERKFTLKSPEMLCPQQTAGWRSADISLCLFRQICYFLIYHFFKLMLQSCSEMFEVGFLEVR